MPTKKQIQSGEKVPLKLTAAERKLILDDQMILDGDSETIIRDTPPGKPVMMTLDELEDFGGYIAAEANHCDDRKKEKKLDTIFEKLETVQDRYTDADDNIISIGQARRKVVQAMEDVLECKNSGVVSFRLPRTRKQMSEKYPVKITALQREAIVSCPRLKAAIKRKLQKADEGTQVIEFSLKELEHMHDELGQAVVFAPSPQKKRLDAVQKKVHDILDEARLVEFGIKQPKKRRRPAAESDLLFQFKISLKGTKPPIWRRIQMRDCSLADFHEHIQAAMGWENCHMHQFIISGERYGPPLDDLDFGLETFDESKVLLSELVPKSGKSHPFIYEYDFGDGWQHEVVFETYPPVKPRTKYPLCLEGERACPPEDIGGLGGYYYFLEAMADPKHEEYEDFMEWCGPFDPEQFSAEQATKEMRCGLQRR